MCGQCDTRDAHRMRQVSPELHSEIHHLKAMRDTLTGDFKERTRQAHRLESELERANPQEKGVAPTQAYKELREQMTARLQRLASERARHSAVVKHLKMEVLDREQEIMGLQYDVSWANEGAIGDRAHHREKPIDWAEELRKTLAEADDAVREKEV